MSVRPVIYPITDIEPIRQALGSGDASLVTRIREAYVRIDEERWHEDDVEGEALTEDEFGDEIAPWEVDEEALRLLTKRAKAFINGKFARNREPGIWREVILYLAHALNLTSSIHPCFGDWATGSWRTYLGQVSEALPDRAQESLAFLVQGRSLSGREIEHDGCSYAWLLSSEISELLVALREVPEDLLNQPAPRPISTGDLLAAFSGAPEREPAASEPSWLPHFHKALVKGLSACEGQCLFLAG